MSIVLNGITFEDVMKYRKKTLQRSVTIFGCNKEKMVLWPVMYNKSGVLPTNTDMPCYYCHHKYNTRPLGCPIAHKKVKTIPDDKKQKKFFKKNNIKEGDHIFETESMFCSWNCMKSYIMNRLSVQPFSSRYANSLSYMSLMSKIIGNEEINKSSDISLLKTYGGDQTIDEWRKGLKTYKVTPNRERSHLFTSSVYILENA